MAEYPFPELETDEEAIAAFVARENARTDAAFAGPEREADEAMLRAILQAEDDVPGVTRHGRFLYTFRQTAEHPRGRWLRLPESIAPTPDAAWEAIFDVDAFCHEEEAVWVWAGYVTNPFDLTRVLISLSEDGSDKTRLVEFDLESCAIVKGGFDLGPDKGFAAWAGPDSLILASVARGDATQSDLPGALRRLERGGDVASAPLICRTDPGNLGIWSGFGRLGGGEWTEVRLEETDIDMGRVTLLRPGQAPLTLPNPPDTLPGFNYRCCAWIANEQGAHETGTLVFCHHDGSGLRVLFTPQAGVAERVESMLFSGDWLLWIEMRRHKPHLMALDTRSSGEDPREIVVPAEFDTMWVGHFDADTDLGDGTLVIGGMSYLMPDREWLFDLARGVEGIVFRPLRASPARFDSAGCRAELWTAVSEDGTEIPYHIVLPRGHEGRKDLPVLLHGYGGFGLSLSPGYPALTGKAWIERGGAYAEALIRGGGEFGPAWHNVAKGAGRVLSFADFAAVATDLVKRGITTPQRIACQGGSNGGLLCGVMLTRYPERFGAVWASVGLYDMLGFTRFPGGRAWIEEYGDPEDPEAREWLRAYSPLHNIPDRPLPATLIDTSHKDDRVDPSHSRRFVAALRAAGHQPYFIEHRGGHGGGGASDETAREIALGYAFLRRALDLQ